jgi:hypothetical protein
VYTFYIYDTKNDQSALYQLKGFAFINVGTPGSVTFSTAESSPFTTRVPLTVKDFAGPAKFISLGARELGVFRLAMEPLGCGPMEISVNTGATMGVTLFSLNAGWMSMIAAFSGPPPQG